MVTRGSEDASGSSDREVCVGLQVCERVFVMVQLFSRRCRLSLGGNTALGFASL